jgi:ribosomal protein L37AE/L43A
MAKCPECGGNMTSRNKRKICETCGLSLSGSEYDRLWDKIHDNRYKNDRHKRSKHNEYLKWYESHK